MKEDAKDDDYTKKICQILKNKAVIITSGRGKNNGSKQVNMGVNHGCQEFQL